MNVACSHLLERSALEGTFRIESVAWAQLEPGRFQVRFGVVDAAPLELSTRSMNVGFTAKAAVAPNKLVLGLLADPSSRARWFGTSLDEESIAATRSTIDLSTEGGASFYQLAVDEEALARLFPSAPDAVALLESARGITLAQDRIHAKRLRTSMHRIFSAFHGYEASPPPRDVPSKALYGTLIPLLASASEQFDRHVVERSKCLNRRLAAVRRCETFMREHIDDTITLLDLSVHSGMRSRSLINAFEAVTGFSPMDYLKRLRLNGVHRALQHARKAGTRIIDLATDWGFWHMGHFTNDYRAMFGETPSQTRLRS